MFNLIDFTPYCVGLFAPIIIPTIFKVFMTKEKKKIRDNSQISNQIIMEHDNLIDKNLSFSRINNLIMIVSLIGTLYFFIKCSNVYFKYGFFATYSANLILYAELSLVSAALFSTATCIKNIREEFFRKKNPASVEFQRKYPKFPFLSETESKLILVVYCIGSMLSYSVLILFVIFLRK